MLRGKVYAGLSRCDPEGSRGLPRVVHLPPSRVRGPVNARAGSGKLTESPYSEMHQGTNGQGTMHNEGVSQASLPPPLHSPA